MIAIDAVQNALRSPQPWSALDELVRAELAAGRLTDHIHDELAATLDQVRAAPEHDEDREEPLLDTLDRLNGFCRADIAYRNPPVLPTEDEIAKLPRWARVAFAARCARRVFALYTQYRNEPHDGRMDLWNAMDSAETSAALARSTMTGRAWAIDVMMTTTNEHAAAIAGSAANAAGSIDGDGLADMNVVVVAAEEYADLRPHIRRDFDLLARLALAYDCTDDTPVPPEVFGPLWPEGKPAGWPDDPEMPKRADLALEAVASERATETMIEDEVVNLFLAMNRFHIARTGHPLTVEDFHPFLAALVPAGV